MTTTSYTPIPTPAASPSQDNISHPIAMPDAQYRSQSPLENPATMQIVFDTALDIPVTLPQHELLAISPDLCRKFKDIITGHPIPTPETEVLISGEYFDHRPVIDALATDTAGLTVAEESLPLRAFSGLLDSRIKVECIVDNGSSIIAMRRSVWEKLGIALCADSVLNMQSSDGSRTTTTGLLRDLPLTIGPSTFYVQVQVSDNLPCEMLLGRPFFTLTNAHTIDYDNGTMDIELTDPNSGMKLRVPTHEKHLRLPDFHAGRAQQ